MKSGWVFERYDTKLAAILSEVQAVALEHTDFILALLRSPLDLEQESEANDVLSILANWKHYTDENTAGQLIETLLLADRDWQPPVGQSSTLAKFLGSVSEVGRSELAAEVQRRALASVSEKIEGIALSDDQILETTDYTEWKAVVDRLSELIDSQLDRLGLDADPTWKAQTIDSLDINSIITSNLEGISHSDDRTDDWGATQRSGMGIDEQIHDLFERDHGE